MSEVETTDATETTDDAAARAVMTVALVGHCGPDTWMLRGAVGRWLPEAQIALVEDRASVEALAGPGTLMLINRVLDGAFGPTTGLELVAELAGRKGGPTVMLISNYPDAQAEAEAAGAAPGLGKRDLGTPAAADRVRHAAG